MKVQLRQIMAGPNGVFPAGTTIDVSKAEAEWLLRSRQAILAPGKLFKKRGPGRPRSESTAMEPVEEVATNASE